jgi:3-oxoacyl-[acyl-carrier-protein] synthase-3
MKAFIRNIEFIVPSKNLTNQDLVKENPDWDVDKIYELTGINNRYVVEEETSADLAVKSGEKFFSKYPETKEQIDYIIFCTQSPDYFLPTSACLVQDRLGLSKEVGAIDVNQGCSGFVYSLGLAKGLIESDQAANVLVITADTYSRFINDKDKSVRTLFGDASACCLVSISEDSKKICPLVHGTDGSGGKNLIVPHGGMRSPISDDSFIENIDENNNVRAPSNLYMNGSAIYTFTLKEIPKVFNSILARNDISFDEIDLVVLHQANKFMLDSLQKKLKIPDNKMHRSYEHFGNTVSSTIPIGLKIEMEKGYEGSKKVLILGFGVGLSWAGTIIDI